VDKVLPDPKLSVEDISDIRSIVKDIDRFGTGITDVEKSGGFAGDIVFSLYTNRSRTRWMRSTWDRMWGSIQDDLLKFGDQHGINHFTAYRKYMYILMLLENSVSLMDALKHRSDAEQRLLYPEIRPGVLNFDSNVSIHPATRVEEALIRCILYATPGMVANMSRKNLFYKPSIGVQIMKTMFGETSSLTRPASICLYGSILDPTKLEEVSHTAEDVSTTGSRDGGPAINNRVAMIGLITNIPERWLAECNPHMPIMPDASEIGFVPGNMIRRSPGMLGDLSGFLQDRQDTLNPL
jgi:hypothetical protein